MWESEQALNEMKKSRRKCATMKHIHEKIACTHDGQWLLWENVVANAKVTLVSDFTCVCWFVFQFSFKARLWLFFFHLSIFCCCSWCCFGGVFSTLVVHFFFTSHQIYTCLLQVCACSKRMNYILIYLQAYVTFFSLVLICVCCCWSLFAWKLFVFCSFAKYFPGTRIQVGYIYIFHTDFFFIPLSWAMMMMMNLYVAIWSSFCLCWNVHRITHIQVCTVHRLCLVN